MGRVLAFDYGTRRVGVAVTDSLKIIASTLETTPTVKIFDFIKGYCAKEEVEAFVVGFPYNFGHGENEVVVHIEEFIAKLKALYPEKPIHKIDERYTSSIAKRTLIASGVSKKDRRNKGSIDAISANLILQSYLEMQG